MQGVQFNSASLLSSAVSENVTKFSASMGVFGSPAVGVVTASASLLPLASLPLLVNFSNPKES